MQFLDPNIVIQHFDITDGMHVADIHSGAGFFTVPLARLVGNYGKVYTIHSSEEALGRLVGEGKNSGFGHIHPVTTDLVLEEHIELPEKVDRIVISHVLFSAKPHHVLAHSYRLLKSEGKIAIIEGSPFTEEEVVHRAGLAGFVKEKRFHAGDHHFGLVFKKV